MDEVIKSFGAILSGLGLAGVVIGGQAYIILWLLKKWQEAQEFRAVEAKEAIKAVTSMEAALTRLTDVLRAGKP